MAWELERPQEASRVDRKWDSSVAVLPYLSCRWLCSSERAGEGGLSPKFGRVCGCGLLLETGLLYF